MKSLQNYINEASNKLKEFKVHDLSPEKIEGNSAFFNKLKRILSEIFSENPEKMYYVQYKNSVSTLFDLIKKHYDTEENFYNDFSEYGVNNYFTFSKWFTRNKGVLQSVLNLQNIDFNIKEKDSDDKQTKSNENIVKREEQENKNIKEQNLQELTVVLYDKDYPNNSRTTLQYKLIFKISDDNRYEKEKELKHKWAKETKLNVTQCNIIELKNYVNKYQSHLKYKGNIRKGLQ
jgi:hypothetical protein